jgi:glycine cleavage system H protein
MVSGTVAEGNEDLEDEPELINEDCYGKGWICKIEPSDLDGDLANLMQGDAYAQWVSAEIDKVSKE